MSSDPQSRVRCSHIDLSSSRTEPLVSCSSPATARLLVEYSSPCALFVLAEERSTQIATFTPAESPLSMRLSSLVPKQPRGQSGPIPVARSLQDRYGRQPAPRPPPVSAKRGRTTEGRHPDKFASSGWFARLTCISPVSLAGLNPHPTPAHSPSSLSRSMNEPIGRTSSAASHIPRLGFTNIRDVLRLPDSGTRST